MGAGTRSKEIRQRRERRRKRRKKRVKELLQAVGRGRSRQDRLKIAAEALARRPPA